MSVLIKDGGCPKCGMQLKVNDWGQYFCPNCGIFDEERQPEDTNKKEQSYIG